MALFFIAEIYCLDQLNPCLERSCVNDYKASSASASFFTGTTSIPSMGCLGALA